jgi:diguanylate cyclase (GGDEF)-like protein
MTRNSDASVAAEIVGASYPVGDIFLFGVLMRMWTAAGARTACYRLLTASLLVTAGADIAWALLVGRAGDLADHRWTDTFWLVGYLLMAAAMVVPSMRTVTESAAEPELETPTVRRLVALAGGLVLPPVALRVDGANGGAIEWATIGIGSIAMSLLVLIRMAGLLGTVQVQAARLSGLARSDPLTGAPNRRSWDFELSRTCQAGREQQTPVCVAMVDLDHFKTYNDAHGHQAGDRLLREAVAAWSEQLGPDGFIARYGGEEFAVLFSGVSVETAVDRIQRLGAVTPGGQTFSAGLAQWDPTTDPSVAVGWADAALYDAKRAGRNRVSVSVNPPPGGDPTATSFACSATTRPELGTSPR